MRVVAIEELPDYDVSNTVIYTPAFVNMESHSWVRAPRLSMIFRIAVNMRPISRNVLENVPENLGATAEIGWLTNQGVRGLGKVRQMPTYSENDPLPAYISSLRMHK